ncbi:WYL domain-containing protein [Flavobacteriaceae bacterium S0862]|nr:WYL domain-containing protein [Flavobacteriaceae bacterium S0862]
MATNKHAQIRYNVLDRCFSNFMKPLSYDELLNEVNRVLIELGTNGIKLRQLQYDIRFMESEAGFSIELEEGLKHNKYLKKRVFRYKDKSFSISDHPLNQSDAEQLETTLAILSRYKNREEFDWLDELFPRIKAAFNLVEEDYDGLISYQSNRDYTGQSLVGVLYNQLIRRKILNIEYKAFDQEESSIRRIHPYHLKQFNNRWFLFGYQKEEKYTGITNLALDRIIGFTETNEDIKPDNTSWGDYFDDMVGVSKNSNDQAVKIKLRFSNKRMKYVVTKPIHGATQRFDKSDPENRTIIIDVILNNELFQTLLSFGSDLEVIEPENVRIRMKDYVDKMSEIYSKKYNSAD